MKRILGLAFLSLSLSAFASDIPGGHIQTAEPRNPSHYEIVLSPGFTFKSAGAYLTSEMRYQATDEFSFGLGFGAGEVGFNFGPSAVWYVMPDNENQPGIAIRTGAYFNRVNVQNYFVVKLAPTISKTFKFDKDRVTPYAAVNFTPSFALGASLTEFGIKTTVGSEFAFSGLSGLHLWAEVGLGIVNSLHEVVVGVSYPFKGL